ncbi:MAG TPA: sigma 54-interacting transcriptional regulator [Methylomusa anaerophila]|uniref:Transcriptional regulatory protein ZraR n=1 Tax=Methylomusa anaerophila TaxID=1930071 RepID=A0A348APJ8_9FIRM|nr:sigma 54-interacting transcriptional regulator [Methylomusa anaerophila]BBB92996.1 transcriptional regulatory protein ZraR [Methylomusa anaerophila]HML87171.1 sigma 54-interacting transcriptional regulator [Methylomusa anaerophila]
MSSLTVADFLCDKFVQMSPDTPASDAIIVLEPDKIEAVITNNGGNWGIVTNDNQFKGNKLGDAADYSVKTVTITALDKPVVSLLKILSSVTVFVLDNATVIGVCTPDMFVKKLFHYYQLQQAMFDAVLGTVGEAVCGINDRDQVVLWNKSAEKLYGIVAEEIIGNPIDNFFSNLLLRKVITEKRAVKDQYHNPCLHKHVLINAAPIQLNSRFVGGISAERDITDIVQLNQELSKTSNKIKSLENEIDKISSNTDVFAVISGHSPQIANAIGMARRVASANVPLLLRGESGTGKEIFARAIHAASGRRGKFIEINCGAIPASLFESELFGYQPGAFTGADRKGKPGLFELADTGTLFLDEIGELPKDMQVKLLRVLQEKNFYRIGGDKPVQVDVRIIAATHRNLEEMIGRNEFRDDLYYRLNVVTINLPPLRDRREDIPELVYKGIKRFTAMHSSGTVINKVEPELMALFLECDWPGNVRELNNTLERLVLLADGEMLSTTNLPANFRGNIAKKQESIPNSTGRQLTISELAKIEQSLIEQVLKKENYNKTAAAKRLGIPRSTLYYKMKLFNIRCSCQ